MADDVRELVDRSMAGDEAAMVELVHRYQGAVFGLCYRMLGDRQDAEDVAQEAFLRVFRNLHTWDPGRDFRPWLLAIAGNRCRSHLALRRRRPATTNLVEELPDPADDDRAVHHLNEEVGLALSTIRDEYRRAFLLFHAQELSYAQISDALDCPVGTVKTWIHRARRELARRLQSRGIVQETGYE
ncbi:MAG: sigma-70 family RNA polymerase sigma factor [Pirellulales bacterium]|nr:sigma-70 family RNA polymerase sigma factor [Pirellulales bacterium]